LPTCQDRRFSPLRYLVMVDIHWIEESFRRALRISGEHGKRRGEKQVGLALPHGLPEARGKHETKFRGVYEL